MNCYYYLHTNGKLIHKPEFVVDSEPSYFDSDFVKKVWHIDTTDRMDAWTLILEALAMGANQECCYELALTWGLTYEDSKEMLARNPEPAELMKKGMELFIPLVFEIQPEDYWEKIKDLQNSEKWAQAVEGD